MIEEQKLEIETLCENLKSKCVEFLHDSMVRADIRTPMDLLKKRSFIRDSEFVLVSLTSLILVPILKTSSTPYTYQLSVDTYINGFKQIVDKMEVLAEEEYNRNREEQDD